MAAGSLRLSFDIDQQRGPAAGVTRSRRLAGGLGVLVGALAGAGVAVAVLLHQHAIEPGQLLNFLIHPAAAFRPGAASFLRSEPAQPSRAGTSPRMSADDKTRREVMGEAALAAAVAAAAVALPSGALAADAKNWRQVPLPTLTKSPTLFDIEIDPDNPMKGYLVGNYGTFLVTSDGGETWEPRSFANLDPDEEITYRFEKVSFNKGDGWIIGKPAIILRTQDSGKSWERVPISPKLPGEPTTIYALGNKKAEMATSSGAIYLTEDGGRNWKAQVKETIDGTLNRISSSGVQGGSYFQGTILSILRDVNGAYVAVSARGNFYLTFQPGDDYWLPHNRDSSRRIQAMGFLGNELEEGLWQTIRGGEYAVAKGPFEDDLSNIKFEKKDLKAGGYGVLDVAFNGKLGTAVGGSGLIFNSNDGGQSWQKDKSANDLPTNLYKVKWFGDKAFILGSGGILLTRN